MVNPVDGETAETTVWTVLWTGTMLTKRKIDVIACGVEVELGGRVVNAVGPVEFVALPVIVTVVA